MRARRIEVTEVDSNGGILFGLEGHIVEIQARAMEYLGASVALEGRYKCRSKNSERWR